MKRARWRPADLPDGGQKNCPRARFFVCDGSPPVLRSRGAAGTWGERVRGRGGSAPFSPRMVARLGVFRQQIADGLPVHRMMGKFRQRPHAGRIARSHGSTGRPDSGCRTLGIDRRCAVGHCVVLPRQGVVSAVDVATPSAGTLHCKILVARRVGTDVRRPRRAVFGHRYATAVQAAWPASAGSRPSGSTPLPAVAWANRTLSPDVMQTCA